MENGEWKAVVESLLFVADTPLSLERIQVTLGELSKKDLQRLLSELVEEYRKPERGITLVEVGEGYQFRTRPEHAEWIKRLKKTKPFTLSQPSMETLAIIAYKQPIVRQDIERIRGVDSGGVLRTLLDRKLIKILGKKDIPGKPLVYGTSKKFLEVFGLKDLSSLPTLKDIENLGAPADKDQDQLFQSLENYARTKKTADEGNSGRAEEQVTDSDESAPESSENNR